MECWNPERSDNWNDGILEHRGETQMIASMISLRIVPFSLEAPARTRTRGSANSSQTKKYPDIKHHPFTLGLSAIPFATSLPGKPFALSLSKGEFGTFSRASLFPSIPSFQYSTIPLLHYSIIPFAEGFCYADRPLG
jgi:hypothetical protein